MKIDLSGKTALVTGSTQGIGLAIAKGLAESGAEVVVNGRKRQSTDAAVQKLAESVPGASGSGIRGVSADLGTAEGCAAMVRAVPQVDILVNNLGIFGPKDYFETTDDVWDTYWQVNVMSGVRLSRAYAQGMAERGWGRILFLASESAYNIPADMVHYGVTKTAYVALARGLAKRLAGTGVTVNSVLPGPTLSDGFKNMVREEQEKTGKSYQDIAAEFVQANRPSSIIRRAAEVEEVANLAVYLASPQASATTGAAMRVDGGVVDSLV